MTEHSSLSKSFTLRSIPVRQMLQSDVVAVVDVHIRSFPNFFLTFLGASFLSVLYTAILADQDGIGFVAEGEKGIYGFVAGTAQPAGFYRRLLHQHWWRFALAAVLPSLKRPKIVPRLLRAFSMSEQVTYQGGCATLMSIAVLPDCHGIGIGRALVLAFLDAVAAQGLHQINLTTDRDSNEAVNRFYQNMGFVCERSYVTPEGRAMNEYLLELSGRSGIKVESVVATSVAACKLPTT